MAVSLDINIIDTNSSRTIGILDVSIYDNNLAITLPKITLTAPGFSAVQLPFQPKRINTFNSNSFGFTSTANVSELSELPDGVYKAVYTESSYEVIKVFMRTEKLRCKLEKALLCLDFCDRKSSTKELAEIEFMIQASIAATNVCNVNLAVELYRKASEELDRFLNKCK